MSLLIPVSLGVHAGVSYLPVQATVSSRRGGARYRAGSPIRAYFTMTVGITPVYDPLESSCGSGCSGLEVRCSFGETGSFGFHPTQCEQQDKSG